MSISTSIKCFVFFVFFSFWGFLFCLFGGVFFGGGLIWMISKKCFFFNWTPQNLKYLLSRTASGLCMYLYFCMVKSHKLCTIPSQSPFPPNHVNFLTPSNLICCIFLQWLRIFTTTTTTTATAAANVVIISLFGFFKLVSTGDFFSLESEEQRVSSYLQDSPKYSGPSKQCYE